MKLAPVIIFTYNRPRNLKRVLNSLVCNKYFKNSKIYIYSDGPKDNNSALTVRQVRKVLSKYECFNNINIFYRKINLGLSESIIQGVNYVISKHKKVIVLEDDLITSPHFLKYMNDALKLLKNNQNVGSIHSYFYPIKHQNNIPNYFFLKGADCWGWATWHDRWKMFEKDGTILLNKIKGLGLVKEFSLENRTGFYKMLEDQIKGKNDSWAIRWHASMFLLNKYTLYPKISYIHNIGNDGYGTHKSDTNAFNTKLQMEYIQLNKIQVSENMIAREELANFMLSLRKPIYKNIISKIKRFFI